MLIRLIDGFLLHRESEGRSAKTLEYHCTSLCLLERWLSQEGLPTDPNEWDASLIRRYFVYPRDRPSAKGKPPSPHSIRCYATSLLAFTHWLHLEEITAKNVAERVSQPKTPQLVKQPFSSETRPTRCGVSVEDRPLGLARVALRVYDMLQVPGTLGYRAMP